MSSPFPINTASILPTDMSWGTKAGPQFMTGVARTLSGEEQRHVQRHFGKWAAQLSWNLERTLPNILTLLYQFMEVQGRSNAFLASMPFGFNCYSELPVPLGSNTYQTVQRQGSGTVTLTRNIKHPIASTFSLWQGKTQISGGSYSLDATTGILTYAGYKPLDIMWVIDRTCNSLLMPYLSGSAFALEQSAIQAANGQINALSASNLMGVTSYANTATNNQALTSNLSTVNASVAGLTASGSSPSISAGLNAGATALAAQTVAGHVPCLILVGSGASTDGTELATIKSIAAAHPTWMIFVVEVNRTNSSSGTFSTNDALMQSLGAAVEGYWQAPLDWAFVRATRQMLGQLFGISCQFRLPFRFDSDVMDMGMNGSVAGWEGVTAVEIFETGMGSIEILHPTNGWDPITPPLDYSAGSKAGPGWNTKIDLMDSGYEGAVQFYTVPIGNYTIGFEPLDGAALDPFSYPGWTGNPYPQLESLWNFFVGRQGQARGFLLNDLRDYVATNVNIGTGAGVQTAFQLVQTYPSGATYTTIAPIPGTLSLTVASVAKTEWVDYTVDYTTGIVTFASAPTGAIVASWEYYHLVRFAEDGFNGTADGPIGRWQQITLKGILN